MISLTCDPQVRPGQNVYLILSSESGGGSQVVAAQPFAAQTASLGFQFAPALAADTYAARLQVDGVLAAVAANWKFTPPATLAVLP